MQQPDDHPWQAIKGRRPRGRPKGKGVPEIPTEKLRAAFEKSRLTKTELARRMGWFKTVGNVHLVSVTLGYEKDSAERYRKRVTYRTAVRLAKAMNADPFELGI